VPPSRIRRVIGFAAGEHGWLVAIAAVYLYVFPWYPKLQSANELPRAYLVSSIVDDHTFAIDRGVARWGWSADLAKYGGHYYANKAPGASLVVVPVYAAVKLVAGAPSLATTMWLARVVTGIIPTLIFLWLLWGFLERFAPDPAIRRLVLVVYAFGSMAMTYSVLYYSHQLSAVCIASAWILAIDVADGKRGVRAMALAGLLAGAAPLVDYEAAFAAVPLLVDIVRRLRGRDDLARLLGVATAAAAVPIAVLLYYHAACFGSALSTGYNYAVTFASDHDHGLLGMTTPTWTAFTGTMITPDNGFVVLAPWWLLAIPGGVLLWRRGDRALVGVIAAIALVFIYFVSSITGWRAGWEIGPRYIVALQPFLLPLVCVALTAWRERPLAIGAACGAMLVGVFIYTATTATLPYWPDLYKNPLYEVTFRLVHDGLAAPSLGRALGLPALVGIAPFVLGIAGVVGWSLTRVTTWRGIVLAVAIATCAIGAFAFAPRTGPRGQTAYTNTLYPAVAQ
jgi:hypothetical protein